MTIKLHRLARTCGGAGWSIRAGRWQLDRRRLGVLLRRRRGAAATREARSASAISAGSASIPLTSSRTDRSTARHPRTWQPSSAAGGLYSKRGQRTPPSRLRCGPVVGAKRGSARRAGECAQRLGEALEQSCWTSRRRAGRQIVEEALDSAARLGHLAHRGAAGLGQAQAPVARTRALLQNPRARSAVASGRRSSAGTTRRAVKPLASVSESSTSKRSSSHASGA